MLLWRAVSFNLVSAVGKALQPTRNAYLQCAGFVPRAIIAFLSFFVIERTQSAAGGMQLKFARQCCSAAAILRSFLQPGIHTIESGVDRSSTLSAK